VTPVTPTAELVLRGPGGEPVDLWRTFVSHGLTDLPPMVLDAATRSMEITLALGPGRARTIRVEPVRSDRAAVVLLGRRVRRGELEAAVDSISHVLRLDQDLSGFYALVADDPDLAWAASGAGRLIRSPTVFEDVVKTVCTTNCSWSATTRMVGALVEHLGQPAPGAPVEGPRGRAFPTPAAMAAAPEDFYRDVARAGYRGRYLRALARSVADRSLDLEALGRATPEELPDDELAARLQALPGVGPYAAAHVMTLLGRYTRLILDSWTRPTYASLAGRPTVTDAAIVRRFRRYGRWAGLAFWLYLTADWAPLPDLSRGAR
jgi:3-methyladenine DNA glycosylase/8-oxoguanine DNA glycosylase